MSDYRIFIISLTQILNVIVGLFFLLDIVAAIYRSKMGIAINKSKFINVFSVTHNKPNLANELLFRGILIAGLLIFMDGRGPQLIFASAACFYCLWVIWSIIVTLNNAGKSVKKKEG